MRADAFRRFGRAALGKPFLAPLVSGPLALLWIAAAPADARAQVELSISGGLLLPLGSVATHTEEGFGASRREWDHRPDGAFGGRITVWLGGPVALEAAGGYAASELRSRRFQPPLGEVNRETESARVRMASLRAVLRLRPRSAPLNYHLIAGAGVIDRGGSAYELVSGGLDATVVLGGGVRVNLAPRIDLRMDVEDHLSVTKLKFHTSVVTQRGSPEGTFLFSGGDRVQNDLLFSSSLVVRL